MTKITRDKRNFKFETLQLHVGQEQADPATDARQFIKHHLMCLEIVIMQQHVLD